MRARQIILLLAVIPLIAAVRIDMVYYDAYNESASEFVQLYNTGNQTINLTGWKLATPSSLQDATLTGSITPNNYYLIADTGWSEHRDNNSWPTADHEETLTLSNNAGFVQLTGPSGSIVSTVGYEGHNNSEGSPHPGAAEGEALVRTSNTGDNSVDFTAQKPSFKTPPEGNATLIAINVTNAEPKIISWWVEDDDLTTQGVQLLPLPGGERQVAVEIVVEDNNSVTEVAVTANEQPLTANSTGARASYNGTIPITTDTKQIRFVVQDPEHTLTHNVSVELLEVVGLSVPNNIRMDASPGSTIEETITIENTGTTNLSIQVKGVAPSLGELLLGPVTYSLLGEDYELIDSFRQHDLGLTPGAQQLLGLKVQTGYVPSGSYSGQILIAGVAS